MQVTPITEGTIRLSRTEVPMSNDDILKSLSTRQDLDMDIRDLLIEEINVSLDENGYQRLIRSRKLQDMVKNVDRAMIDPILVSMREDGTYWCIDGHHRLEAARQRGETTIKCRIVYGLTIEEEAELFVKMAKGRSEITAYDTYRADLAAKDPNALAVRDMLAAFGFRFVDTTRRVKTMRDDRLYPIAAVSTVRDIYRQDDGKTLERVLDVVTNKWDIEEIMLATERPILAGLARMISRGEGVLDQKRFQRTLENMSPGAIKSKASTYRVIMGGGEARAVVAAILEKYNSGIRKQENTVSMDVFM